MTSYEKKTEAARLHRSYVARKSVRTAIKILAMTFIFVVVLAPLAWMIITSFKSKLEMYTFPVNYLPTMPTLEHYGELFGRDYLWRNMLNSLILSLAAPAISAICATMTGYALAKIDFRGSRLVLMFFLMTQMLPTATAVLPMYMLLAKMNLVNKLSTVVVMLGAGGISFCIIMLQGFIRNVPDDIEEAALIDGCSRVNCFVRIVLPLLKGGIFTVVIFQFINCWNDTYTSMVYLTNDWQRTLPVLIHKLVGKYDINWGQVAAASTISLIPTCILFGVMKNFFIEGITSGAVKG